MIAIIKTGSDYTPLGSTTIEVVVSLFINVMIAIGTKSAEIRSDLEQSMSFNTYTRKWRSCAVITPPMARMNQSNSETLYIQVSSG
jgi:hypothetical protein